MKRPTTVYDDATKQRALQRAREVGPEAAARELDIPAGTLRRWRTETGAAGPPSGADPEEWASRKAAGAAASWEAAQAALARVRALLEAGDERKAKDLAITFAVLVDKAGVLEVGAAQADERRVRLAGRQSELIVWLLEHYHAVLGLPYGTDARKVLAALLRQAAAGEALTDPPEAAAAREAIRAAFGAEAGGPPERLALPERVEVAEVVDAEAADVESEPEPVVEADAEAEPVEAEPREPPRTYRAGSGWLVGPW